MTDRTFDFDAPKCVDFDQRLNIRRVKDWEDEPTLPVGLIGGAAIDITEDDILSEENL